MTPNIILSPPLGPFPNSILDTIRDTPYHLKIYKYPFSKKTTNGYLIEGSQAVDTEDINSAYRIINLNEPIPFSGWKLIYRLDPK